MKGIFEGLVTGSDSYIKKGETAATHRTAISLGMGTEITLNRNGLQTGAPVFVIGDVRRRQDGGAYIQGEAEVFVRPAGVTLADMAQLFNQWLASSNGADAQ